MLDFRSTLQSGKWAKRSLSATSRIVPLLYLFGCATGPAGLKSLSAPGAVVTSGGVRAQVAWMTLSANAVNAGIWVNNLSGERLTITSKDIRLIDSDGGSVTPSSGLPPEYTDVVTVQKDWTARDVAALPFAIAGGLIVWPVMIPLNLCCPQLFGEKRSSLLPDPSWEPSYSPNAVLVEIVPDSEATVSVYFDRKAIKVDKLRAVRINNPLTNETIEAPIEPNP